MSTPIILSTAAGPPPVAVEAFLGLTHEWYAPDGSVWDLNDWETGITLDPRGVEGLHNPLIERFTSSSRLVPGHRRRGWRTLARDAFWPVFLFADSSEDWLALHRAFFATIHPDREGRWRVTSDTTYRELAVTGVFDESHAYETDPVEDGWGQYGVSLEAAQPYWQGPRVRRGPWRIPDPVPFFPGPPFRISTSSNFATAAIPNLGDVDVWGVWWVTGPLSAVELGVGDTILHVPFEVPDGETLRIDTDPRRPTAQRGPTVLDSDGRVDTDAFVGTDATTALGMQNYARIPPGQSVPLHVDATGSGSVMFDIHPLFFRAF